MIESLHSTPVELGNVTIMLPAYISPISSINSLNIPPLAHPPTPLILLMYKTFHRLGWEFDIWYQTYQLITSEAFSKCPTTPASSICHNRKLLHFNSITKTLCQKLAWPNSKKDPNMFNIVTISNITAPFSSHPRWRLSITLNHLCRILQ